MAIRRKRRSTAVVVSEDAGLRKDLADWLEADGIEVMGCPGPRAPHFSCIGLRGGPCPLVGGADVVLLDLHPEPGQLIDRTGRAELVSYYRQRGRHLVVMVDAANTLELPGTEGVAVVERLAEQGTVVGTVRQVLSGSPGPVSPL